MHVHVRKSERWANPRPCSRRRETSEAFRAPRDDLRSHRHQRHPVDMTVLGLPQSPYSISNLGLARDLANALAREQCETQQVAHLLAHWLGFRQPMPEAHDLIIA